MLPLHYRASQYLPYNAKRPGSFRQALLTNRLPSALYSPLSMNTNHHVTVIGGGIIGLATALELSARYPNYSIAVLEKEQRVASHQTGHNSGVIHSGLYYRPGSYKAELCIAGSRALRDYCDNRGVSYNLIGKVVVATHEEELPRLQTLYERGTANGVEGLQMIGPARLKELEPHAYGIKALHSPKTGIVDFKEVAAAYSEDAQRNGAEIVLGAKVNGITTASGLINLETTKGDFQTNYLINCAGLQADAIVEKMGLRSEVRIIPFRGEYFTLKPEKHHLVKSLIYPVPNPQFPFLGVHFTRMIHGGVEAGPNAVLAFAREGYTMSSVNIPEFLGTATYRGFWMMAWKYWRTGLGEFYRSLSKPAFTRALQRLLPEIKKEDLAPAGAGVRAQAVDRKGALLDDFSIVETENALHVLNAPSPAATSSLALGKYLVDRAAKSLDLQAK